MSGARSGTILRAAIAAFALALLSASAGPVVAAEKWDLYIYNPVSTVAAVKGLNTAIEQIEKETGGELTIRLHLGGSLPINTTTITQAVSDDVVQMGDDGYFLGNVPIGGVLRLPMLIRTPRRIRQGRGHHEPLSGKGLRARRACSCSASISIRSRSRSSSKKLTSLADYQGPEDPRDLAGAGRVHQAARRHSRDDRRAGSSLRARPRRRRRRAHRQHRRRQYLEGPAEVQLPARHQLLQFGGDREQGALRKTVARRSGARCARSSTTTCP